MNNEVKKFLDEVCGYIKYKGIHDEIKEELKMHIEELTESYKTHGFSENDAIKKSLTGMGNASEIGQKLNSQHKPQTEWSLIILTFIISAFGILVMYVSSKFENQAIPFTRYIIHIVMGTLVLFGVYFFDYTKMKKHSFKLYFSAVFLLIICMIAGTRYNGIKSYINLGIISLSVNPVAGMLFVASFCGFLDRYRDEGFAGIIKMILLGAFSMLFFMLQPSMSMVFILFIVYSVVLLRAISMKHFGGNSKIQMISVLSFGSVASVFSFIFVIIKNPHRINKMFMFFDNGARDPSGSGWIYVIADKLLKSSEPIGKAAPLPEGSPDWIMPSITTDFAFLNLITNFGLLAGAVLILIISVLIVRMFIISGKIKNSFGFYLSLSSCIMLAIQFVMNALMNFGLCPYSDISMPFISYGGTNFIINMIYVGIILSVWRKNNILIRTYRNITSKHKMITFSDNKLIIDFNDYPVDKDGNIC